MVAVSYEPDWMTDGTAVFSCTVPESDTLAKHLVDGDYLADQVELLLPHHLLQPPRHQQHPSEYDAQKLYRYLLKL